MLLSSPTSSSSLVYLYRSCRLCKGGGDNRTRAIDSFVCYKCPEECRRPSVYTRERERERGRPLHDAPILPVVQMWWVSSVCRLVLSSLLFLYIYISLLLLLTMTAVSLDRTSSNIRHRIDELRISFVARASHHSS